MDRELLRCDVRLSVHPSAGPAGVTLDLATESAHSAELRHRSTERKIAFEMKPYSSLLRPQKSGLFIPG
jgi:hypothetical protein